MPLTCCLLTNSNRLPNAGQALKSLNITGLGERDKSFVCWINDTCCLVQLNSVADSSSVLEESIPRHSAQLVVVLTDTRQALSQDRSSNVKLACLMTSVLTQLCKHTDAVGILWQEHLLHDMDMWDAWCSSELPISLWVDIAEDAEALGYALKTIGLSFFRQCEVFLHSSLKADANLLGQFLGVLEYLITSDETLVEGNCLTFFSADSRNADVEMLVKKVKHKTGDKCEAHLELVTYKRKGTYEATEH